MFTVTRRFEFDYGHRVLGHEGKCRWLHGHRGAAEVTVQAPLDGIGRVIDFGAIKTRIGDWITSNWDHNMILNSEDPLYKLYAEVHYEKTRTDFEAVFDGRLPYSMYVNPTAENLAEELFDKSQKLLGIKFKVTRVRFWETPNCYADFYKESS